MKTIMIVMVKREVCGPSITIIIIIIIHYHHHHHHPLCGPSRSGDNLVARHGGDTGTPLTLPLTRAARDQESLEARVQRHTQIEAHIECWRKSENVRKYHGTHSKDRKDKYNDKYTEKDKDRQRQA